MLGTASRLVPPGRLDRELLEELRFHGEQLERDAQASGASVEGAGSIAVLAARWIQPLLFEQSARDPGTYGAVASLLLLVAVGGSAVPALRATRADPHSALRSE